MGRLARSLLAISDAEVSFSRRGFRGADEPPRAHLEKVGRAFVAGYSAALDDDRLRPLAARLDGVEEAFRGWAYEGAAMGLTLLDAFQPWRPRRLLAYLAGPAAPHIHLAHVGVGWAIARLPGRIERHLRGLDPVFRGLAVDGYGFSLGFFHWPRFVAAQQVPDRARGDARRVFDQGLGRSLWFVEGAGVARITATIAGFPEPRRADLWSGVGLACAYAGGLPESAVEALREACAPYLPEVAQGAVFAATARSTAANPAPWTESACRVLCGLSADEAARLGQDAAASPGEEPSYDALRRRLQESFRRGGIEPWSATAFSAARR